MAESKQEHFAFNFGKDLTLKETPTQGAAADVPAAASAEAASVEGGAAPTLGVVASTPAGAEQAQQQPEEEEEEWIELAAAQEEHGSTAPRAGEHEEVTIEGTLTMVKGRVTGTEAATLLGDTRVEGNDLIPGIYEGGFKLWEGSLDLCRHLCQMYGLDGTMFSSPAACRPLEGKKVLELGCGHGLPGILCMMAGATVHFQDYNSQVVRELTMPNVGNNLARMPPGRPRPASRFFSGDWAYTGELLSSLGLGGHYDLILTSESIYNEDAQVRLLECIKQVLQPPHGVAFVASKTFYFGVGGGTKSFRRLVKKDGIFEVKTLATIEEPGSGNKREVLQLQFPEAIAPYFL